jgi:hypothetical protein
VVLIALALAAWAGSKKWSRQPTAPDSVQTPARGLDPIR